MPRSSRILISALALSCACAFSGCDEPPFPNDDELTALNGLHTLPAQPPPDPTNRLSDDPKAAALGTSLFNDVALSRCGNVSCASCHEGEGRTVAEATAIGCDGQRTGRNPPTVLNTGHGVFYMWDGRADRLWSQALLPLLSPVEMASSPEILRARLSEAYSAQYVELFGETPADSGDDELLANFGKVIAAYERTLSRTGAPFDETVRRFVHAVSEGTAEDDPAYLGLKMFVRKGQCAVCHSGPALSDDRFHNIGVEDRSDGAIGATAALPQLFAWTFNAAGPHSDDRTGAAANRLHNLEADLAKDPASFEGAFRTPTLRNVTLTAPYMHTGALATLEEVIDLYARGGDEEGSFTGRKTETIREIDFTPAEKAALLELLESMTAPQ